MKESQTLSSVPHNLQLNTQFGFSIEMCAYSTAHFDRHECYVNKVQAEVP